MRKKNTSLSFKKHQILKKGRNSQVGQELIQEILVLYTNESFYVNKREKTI